MSEEWQKGHDVTERYLIRDLYTTGQPSRKESGEFYKMVKIPKVLKSTLYMTINLTTRRDLFRCNEKPVNFLKKQKVKIQSSPIQKYT